MTTTSPSARVASQSPIDGPPMPLSRGPLSAHLIGHLQQPVHPLPPLPSSWDDPLTGDDFQLALYLCYELHYQGLCGVDSGWEWEPSLLAVRKELESAFCDALLSETTLAFVGDVPTALTKMIDAFDGPSMSRFMEISGSLSQAAEFAVHRSAYQLKEADPHTWAIPRLTGEPKSAMIQIQADEYGQGVPGQSHAELFAAVMAGFGLDPTYGAYVDLLPGVTLATVNLVTFFGLHRRWRGALVGHLAVFEMTSATPMARYARAFDRMGLGDDVRRFYDVHVEADEHHAVVGAQQLAGGLAAQEPALAGDIVFGAAALMAVEDRFARHLLDCWSRGVSSLREVMPVDPLPTAA